MNFPRFNQSSVLVDCNGRMTKEALNYFNELQGKLSRILASDGHVVPNVTKETIAQIEADNGKNTQTTHIFNDDTGRYMLLNPKTKKFENIETKAVTE